MPTDSAMTGSIPILMKRGTNTMVQMMKTTLYIAGDVAGMKKRRTAFSMPMNAAATATSIRNGMLTRAISVVSAIFSGVSV